MNSFMTFLRKELLEGHRSKRLYILMGIFMFFGMASPILARYMQEIISLAMGAGAPVLTDAPMWTDGFRQFYNNLSQIGAISVLLLFMNAVSGEKISKTAALTLTKNLTPPQFILAKFCAAVLTTTAAFLPSLLLCLGYTRYLFGFAGRPLNIFISGGMFLMFAIALLAVTILASAVCKTTAGSAIFAFTGYLLLILSAYLPIIGDVMPGRLPASSLAAVSGIDQIKVFIYQIIASAAFVFFCIHISIQIFKSQEI